MNVGPVYVCVGNWLVHMEMGMLLLALTFFVLMDMVFVMYMGMGMSDCFMPVDVPMDFPIEEKHSRKHQQCCYPVLSGWSLTKKDD
jgi:hypothetical protein